MDFSSHLPFPVNMPAVPSSWSPHNPLHRNSVSYSVPYSFPTSRSSISSVASSSSANTSSSTSSQQEHYAIDLTSSPIQHHSYPSPYGSANGQYTQELHIKSEPLIDFGDYHLDQGRSVSSTMPNGQGNVQKDGQSGYEGPGSDEVEIISSTGPVPPRFQSSLRLPTVPSQNLALNLRSYHDTQHHPPHYSAQYSTPTSGVPIDPFLSGEGFNTYPPAPVKQEDISPPYSPPATSGAYTDGYVEPTYNSAYVTADNSGHYYYPADYYQTDVHGVQPLSPAAEQVPQYYVDPQATSAMQSHSQPPPGYASGHTRSDTLRRRALGVEAVEGTSSSGPSANGTPEEEMDELEEANGRGSGSPDSDKVHLLLQPIDFHY
ncbi:hypothetical protein BT69DRAFT_962657 [Atractiella rhizophila]|nr:hypothetical protein BT69DRAFT_962657 [Atractiella rhizophila]